MIRGGGDSPLPLVSLAPFCQQPKTTQKMFADNSNNTETKFNKGDSIFIPAQDGCYEIMGKCEVVLSHI